MTSRNRLPLLLSCVLTSVLFSACNKSVDLKLRFEPGDKRVVHVRSEVDVTMTLGDTEIPLPKDIEMRYAFEVQSIDSTGAATVKITTNTEGLLGVWKPRFELQGGAGSPLANVGDFDLTATIAPDGTVKSVEGMAPVVERILDDMEPEIERQMARAMSDLPRLAQAKSSEMGGADAALEKLGEIVRGQLDDDTAEKRIEDLFDFYPTESVRVGSTWTKEKTIRGIKESAVYTVASRNEGIMNIEVKTTVSGSYDGEAGMSITGEESGTLQIDEATGWVISGETDSRSDGFITGKGTDHIESYDG